MMLLDNGAKPPCGFAKRILLSQARNIALLLSGIIMTGGIALLISEFDTGSHGTVYAVNSSLEGGRQFQAGLMGVVNGVENMERYSDAARLMDMGDTKGSLAGMDGVDRRAVHRAAFSQGTGKAKELGYFAQQTVQENQMPSEEYYTLLRIVEAEATGGDVTSKMMVAGVVLNRVRDSHFPDTICQVVWDSGQFQPVSDGRLDTCTVTDSTVEAVERVLAGEDYSQGALFFLARNSAAKSSASWFDSSLAKLFEYGGHEYYTYWEYVQS